jgi:hypothetical protein
MHHADIEFDATTGLRFHPVEIVMSMGIKLAVLAVVGSPAVAVLIFEVLLNGTALFNHANIDLPRRVDRWLRLILVTRDMHRVHHSTDPRETNSNYGFNLPWWDRLLGTYVAQPAKGHHGMEIGIEQFRTRRDLCLLNQTGFTGEQKARKVSYDQRKLREPFFDRGTCARGAHGSGERSGLQIAVAGGRLHRGEVRMQPRYVARLGQQAGRRRW